MRQLLAGLVPVALFVWLGVGLVLGLLGRWLLPGGDRGFLSVLVATTGALAGGAVATAIGSGGVAVVDPHGLVLVVLTAVVALLLLRVAQARTAKNGPR